MPRKSTTTTTAASTPAATKQIDDMSMTTSESHTHPSNGPQIPSKTSPQNQMRVEIRSPPSKSTAAAAVADKEKDKTATTTTTTTTTKEVAGSTSKEKEKEKEKEHKEPKPKKDKDDLTIDDLLLPRTLISRLSRGSLPPNTSLQKDALLALTKSATVFISYLAHTANNLTARKTIQAADVLAAINEMELEGVMMDRLVAEVKLFEDGVRGKRKGYRDRVKARESGVSQADDELSRLEGDRTDDIHETKRVKRSADGDVEMDDVGGQSSSKARESVVNGGEDDDDEDDPSAQLLAETRASGRVNGTKVFAGDENPRDQIETDLEDDEEEEEDDDDDDDNEDVEDEEGEEEEDDDDDDDDNEEDSEENEIDDSRLLLNGNKTHHKGGSSGKKNSNLILAPNGRDVVVGSDDDDDDDDNEEDGDSD